MLSLRLQVNPVPASRPRVSRFGTYYGKRHQAFRSSATALLSEMRERGDLPEPPLSGRLKVQVIFHVKKPKHTTLKTPRGDIDNYCKILLDCCNKVVWGDDIQVVLMFAAKAFTDQDGWIDLWVTELSDDAVNNVWQASEDPQSEEHDPQSPNEQGDDFGGGGFVSVPDL